LEKINPPQMKILIVAASFSEIKPLVEKAVIIEKIDESFSLYRLDEKEIGILITGIGMVSTAYHLGRILGKYKFDFAFNLGIAGSFDKTISTGSVVNVDSDILSELGAENGNEFLKFDQLGMGTSSMSKTLWKGKNNFEICNPALQQLQRVKGITVNTVHGNNDSIKKVCEHYSPDIETMEGAAFLSICNTEKIKCAQIRSISNFVEERNKDNWEIEKAIKSLNDAASRILKTI
jgi:futalosine hydrolase